MPTPRIIPARKGGTPLTVSASQFVYVEKSCTKNMQDYNSAKITIGITLPFNPTSEDIVAAKATVKKAIEVVDPLIESEVIQLMEEGEEDIKTHRLGRAVKKPRSRY